MAMSKLMNDAFLDDSTRRDNESERANRISNLIDRGCSSWFSRETGQPAKPRTGKRPKEVFMSEQYFPCFTNVWFSYFPGKNRFCGCLRGCPDCNLRIFSVILHVEPRIDYHRKYGMKYGSVGEVIKEKFNN